MKFLKLKNRLIVKTNNSYVFLKVNNDEDGKEVEWITVKGNHIPIKKGQSKEEAVKSFIEGKKGSEKVGKPSGIKFKEFVDKAGEKSMRALIERNGGKVEAKKEDGFVSGKIYAPEGKKIRGTKEDVFASFEVREEDFEDFVNKRLGKDSKYFEERSEGGSDKGNKEQDYTSSRFFRSVFTPFSVDKNDKKTYRPAIESAENDLKNKIQKEEDWLKKQEGSKNYWIYKIRLDAMKKDLEKLKRFKEE